MLGFGGGVSGGFTRGFFNSGQNAGSLGREGVEGGGSTGMSRDVTRIGEPLQFGVDGGRRLVKAARNGFEPCGAEILNSTQDGQARWGENEWVGAVKETLNPGDEWSEIVGFKECVSG